MAFEAAFPAVVMATTLVEQVGCSFSPLMASWEVVEGSKMEAKEEVE